MCVHVYTCMYDGMFCRMYALALVEIMKVTLQLEMVIINTRKIHKSLSDFFSSLN